ncbi:uncharacterized protein METZ01_LOCUS317500, partial [marine metagenome]
GIHLTVRKSLVKPVPKIHFLARQKLLRRFCKMTRI